MTAAMATTAPTMTATEAKFSCGTFGVLLGSNIGRRVGEGVEDSDGISVGVGIGVRFEVGISEGED